MPEAKYQPYRFSADLDKLDENKFVVIKLGFFWHSLKGMWEFWRYNQLVQASTKRGIEIGLYHTEYFLYSQNHAGFIQYWRSFKDLENWSRRSPEHLAWWREMEQSNKWKDMSAYHEVFLVEKAAVETIYNLPHSMKPKDYPGLAHFLPHLTNASYRARERFLKDPDPS